MGRIPGTVVKVAGRKKGTPNKSTGELRSIIAKIVSDNIEQVNADLAAMQPKDRVAMLDKLIAYVLPKMQAITADVSADVSQRSRIDFSKLSDKDMAELADKIQDAAR